MSAGQIDSGSGPRVNTILLARAVLVAPVALRDRDPATGEFPHHSCRPIRQLSINDLISVVRCRLAVGNALPGAGAFANRKPDVPDRRFRRAPDTQDLDSVHPITDAVRKSDGDPIAAEDDQS